MSEKNLSIPGLLGDMRLLVILFVSFRFMLTLVHQPYFIDSVERGMSAGGDIYTYYSMAQLLGVPFQTWWTEFPPVWAFLFTGIHNMLGTEVTYTAFATIIAFIMLLFDTGNLLLIRDIGGRLHGANTGMTLAWVYALTLAPMVFLWWTFETMVAFFMLAPVALLLRMHGTRASIMIGIGALIKFTPALLLGAIWRFRKVKYAARHTIVALGIFVLAYVPLFMQNAAMTMPSLTAQFNKASYQTVWALLDGNFRTGSFGLLTDRLDPERANVVLGNPSRIPGMVRLPVALAIGLFIYARTRRFDDKGLVAFLTITLLIFFLQAQGWSPQWLAQIIPLLLLCFPTRNGILITIILSLVVFAEYPFLFMRSGDTGGEITGTLVMPFVLLILARTAILAGLCVGLYRILRQEPVK